MGTLKLYQFTACPFSRTVRICLRENNIDYELVHEKPWERNEAFLAMNPLGTTPVLLLDNEIVIRGVYSAVEFIEDCSTEPKLLVGDPENRAHIRYIFHWFTQKFYDEVTQYILSEKIIRIIFMGGSPDSGAIRAAKHNITYHLDYMSHLLSHNTYLCGERVTIADCAAAGQLSVLDIVGDVPWENYPKVKAWYSLMKSRPSFNSILKDEIIGINTPKYYSDPDF